MDADDSFPQTGIINPDDADTSDSMDTLAHAVLDDVLYNIIHSIVLKTHRDEKISKAHSAAILVEQIAAEQNPNEDESSSKSHRVVTDGAIFEDGKVTLQGNPLVTTKEVLCSKCGLPRLLLPTDGIGGKKPDPEKQYCTRHPFIDKWDHDIYGQRFPTDAIGPGRGRKKKDQVIGKAQAESGANSFDSPGGSPPPEEKAKAPSFPSVKCHVCQRFLMVRRFAAHLEKCMGVKGRASGRAAALKINGNGNSVSATPPPSLLPGSRKGTPSLSQQSKKASPTKRDRDRDRERDRDEYDFDEDESSDEPMKKKRKKVAALPVKKTGKLLSGLNGKPAKKWKSQRADATPRHSAVPTSNGTTHAKPAAKPATTGRRNSDSSGTLSSP